MFYGSIGVIEGKARKEGKTPTDRLVAVGKRASAIQFKEAYVIDHSKSFLFRAITFLC